jgi:hypothetical protein
MRASLSVLFPFPYSRQTDEENHERQCYFLFFLPRPFCFSLRMMQSAIASRKRKRPTIPELMVTAGGQQPVSDELKMVIKELLAKPAKSGGNRPKPPTQYWLNEQKNCSVAEKAQ